VVLLVALSAATVRTFDLAFQKSTAKKIYTQVQKLETSSFDENEDIE
jgi:hypothetical protein